jgi:hypothetical protein
MVRMSKPVVNETEHASDEFGHAGIELLEVGLLALRRAGIGELLDGFQRVLQEVEVL